MNNSPNSTPIAYSQLLIEFIEPLLTGQEDELEFWEKAKAGQIAWNFCISDQSGILGDDYMKTVLKQITDQHPQAKEVLNTLTLRKQTHFAQYDQYILQVETRRKPNGEVTLYVESAAAFALPKMR